MRFNLEIPKLKKPGLDKIPFLNKLAKDHSPIEDMEQQNHDFDISEHFANAEDKQTEQTDFDDMGTAKALEESLANPNNASKPKSKNSNKKEQISVIDPGSEQVIDITGNVIDTSKDPYKLTEYLQPLILVTTNREILFSRSEKSNPHVLSAIKRFETIMGQALFKIAVDMSTIEEIHDISRKNNDRTSNRNNQSTMQRAFIAIVANAAQRGASDVRIVVNQNIAITRFRIDGVYKYISEMPPQYAQELLSAAFAMADASDPSYQPRQLQGARISNQTTELPAGVQSLRLQFNPLANEGRVIIVRLLYSDSAKIKGVESLGYSKEQIKQLSIMTARPVGINIISGPTGSGKSTTLKVLLDRLLSDRGDELATITIEDPPEYVISAAEQIPVTNTKTQEDRSEAFTQAITAGLRSDPDLMMIGEIRDRASADLAIEGAVSGHPIYASLHANTAMDILTRLRNMGIKDHNIFDHTIFSGLVGQRLVRRLCPHCRIEYHEALRKGMVNEFVQERIQHMCDHTPTEYLETSPIYLAGNGCEHCSGGYAGRSVIAEIILPDAQFMSLVKDSKKAEAVEYWFKQLNGLDLLGAAWMRVLEGAVSPIDVDQTVALLQPYEIHKHALGYWLNKTRGSGTNE